MRKWPNDDYDESDEAPSKPMMNLINTRYPGNCYDYDEDKMHACKQFEGSGEGATKSCDKDIEFLGEIKTRVDDDRPCSLVPA